MLGNKTVVVIKGRPTLLLCTCGISNYHPSCCITCYIPHNARARRLQ